MDAIISDIHANLAAFEAVLADIETKGADRILCLGDVVGYGPDPEACLTLARERCTWCLRGNHDVAALLEPLGFNQAARRAAIWTRKQIEPGLFSLGAKKRNWQFLLDAPERMEEEGMLFVHGSPRDPIMEYIEEAETHDLGFGGNDKLDEIFAAFETLCFVGHTHRAGVIDGAYDFHDPIDIEHVWPRDRGKAVVNVGSVGQPRDNDARACYVTLDEQEIRYHRVEYDTEATATRIRAIRELDDALADRLLVGK